MITFTDNPSKLDTQPFAVLLEYIYLVLDIYIGLFQWPDL